MARRALISGVLAVLTLVILSGQDARSTARTDAGSAAKRCARYLVGTTRVCLRAGQRCNSLANHDYLKAGLECHRRRLRRAGLASRREGEPLLINAHGQIDRRNALEAFNSKIAPLPGIKTRKGAVGRITDATEIIAAVEAQRSRLTLAQRAVLDRVLLPQPNAVPAETPADVQAFTSLIGEAAQRIRAHGYAINHRIALFFTPTSTVPGGTKDVDAYVAPGWLDQIPGYTDACLVYVTPRGIGENLADRRRVIAHELFHCAEDEFFASNAQRARAPQWLIEGAAEWVGNQIGREWNGFDRADGHWTNWLANPGLDLGRRDYDAVGFWAVLQQSGVDVFVRLHGVLSAAATGGDFSAYGTAIGNPPDALFKTWGPGFDRSRVLAPNWDLTGPGIVPSRPPHTVINDGTISGLGVDARGAFGWDVSLEADVIVVKARVSHGLIHTSTGDSALRNEVLCTKAGGCSCEDGKLNARQVAKGIAAIGWQGGGVTLAGSSVQDECERQGKGKQQGGGGGGAPGGIMLFRRVGGTDTIVARFRSGSCSVGRGGFHARASDSGYRLDVYIRKYTGLHRYTLRYRSSDPSFVIQGPGGPFSNVNFPAGGTPPPSGGAITLSPRTTLMGLGFIDAFNRGSTADVLPAGVMTCRYPRR